MAELLFPLYQALVTQTLPVSALLTPAFLRLRNMGLHNIWTAATLPVALFFIFMQKYIISGTTDRAVRG